MWREKKCKILATRCDQGAWQYLIKLEDEDRSVWVCTDAVKRISDQI
jgi:hypothetical protein